MTLAQMIEALQQQGLSQQEIAQLVECSQPTIHRVSKGADPGWKRGNRIEALYRQRILETAAAA
jgi:predicted transcriptional regulator